MLAIVQRGGATHEKPPEVVRGQASRLPWVWDGLCFGVPFNDPTRDSARDLIYNVAPSTTSGLQWARDDRGNPTALLGASSYIDYPDTPAHNKPSTAITAYARIRRVGSGDFPGGGILIKRYGSVNPWISWGITNSDTYDNAMMGYLTVGGTSISWDDQSTPYQIPTTSWLSIFLRWRSGTNPRLDVLGPRGETLESISYGSAVSGSISYVSGQVLRLNGTDDVLYNFNAQYSQAMLWSRRLSDTEIQALVTDPYGWYSPRRETLGVSSPYPLFGMDTLMVEVPSG